MKPGPTCTTRIAIALIAHLLSACGGAAQPELIGDATSDEPDETISGVSNPNGTGGGSPEASGEPPIDEALANDLLGTWEGYVVDRVFVDGSDSLSMTINRMPEPRGSGLAGWVVFGDLPPPPPARIPSVGYPPAPYVAENPTPGSAYHGEVPGFVHAMLRLSYDGRRLQFDVEFGEVWTDWCAMQTPLEDEGNPGSYTCIQSWGYSYDPDGCWQVNPETGQENPMDCGMLELCSAGGPCGCSAEACSARSDYASAHFDMVIAPSHADGSYGYQGANDFSLTRN